MWNKMQEERDMLLRDFDRDEREAFERGREFGRREAMERMHGQEDGYGERGGYGGGYGERGDYGGDYGERRGVRGTGPYGRRYR